MTTTGYRLGPRVRRCIAITCWFGAALSLAIGPILALTDLFRDKSGCSRDTIGTFASPDDNWVAFVQEEICSDGPSQPPSTITFNWRNEARNQRMRTIFSPLKNMATLTTAPSSYGSHLTNCRSRFQTSLLLA